MCPPSLVAQQVVLPDWLHRRTFEREGLQQVKSVGQHSGFFPPHCMSTVSGAWQRTRFFPRFLRCLERATSLWLATTPENAAMSVSTPRRVLVPLSCPKRLIRSWFTLKADLAASWSCAWLARASSETPRPKTVRRYLKTIMLFMTQIGCRISSASRAVSTAWIHCQQPLAKPFDGIESSLSSPKRSWLNGLGCIAHMLVW